MLTRATRTLVRRATWVQRRSLVLNGLFIGLCLCLALAIWQRVAPLPLGQFVEVGLALIGLSVLGAIGMGLRVRVDPLGLLIKADRTLHLQERLSTAYELAQSRQPHPLRSLVAQEAARVARFVNPFRVIPTPTSRPLRWTPFLLLAMVLVLVLDVGVILPPTFWGDDDRPHPALYEQGQKLERLGKRLETEARRRGLERTLEASRRMQNLGLRLQNDKINEREAVARVGSLTEYIRNLEEELKKMSILEDVNIGSVREVMVNQASVAGEMQRLLGRLARGRLSPAEMRNLEERLQSLGQQGIFGDRLSEALNHLREGNLEGAKEVLESLLMQDQLAQDFEQLKRAERALDRGFEDGAAGSDEMDFEHPGGEPGEYGDYEMAGDARQGRGGAPGDLEGGDFLDSEGAGSSSSVGSGRGTERETTRSRLAEGNSPASKVTGQTGEGGVRRAYVRALPLKADASIPLEDVIATYQRRAEESLSREEIPFVSRDIVKAYFLSIGLVEESAGSEMKDEKRER